MCNPGGNSPELIILVAAANLQVNLPRDLVFTNLRRAQHLAGRGDPRSARIFYDHDRAIGDEQLGRVSTT
jgi:hypothetical protein